MVCEEIGKCGRKTEEKAYLSDKMKDNKVNYK
jgi:hypothetical protein